MDMFFVVRVKWLSAGGIKKSEVMSYPTEQQAIKKFFTNMATDIDDSTLSGSMCVVLDMEGNPIKRDSWGHWVEDEPAQEPDSEPK